MKERMSVSDSLRAGYLAVISLSPMVRMLGVIAMIVCLLAFIKYRQIVAHMATHGEGGPPPQAVVPYVVAERLWRERLNIVGTLTPVQGVMFRAEEEGRVVGIEVSSGATVTAGQILFALDTSVERAALTAAEARRDLARLNRARSMTLRKQQAVSESSLDTAAAEERELTAEVARLSALIEKKTIRAPFAGEIGIRQINVGDYVQRGTAVVSLNNLASLYLNFSVPERYLLHIKAGEKVNFSVDAEAGRGFEATISTIDPEIDGATRSVRVQASVDNTERRLRPGMFARVSLELGSARSLPTVPLTSIVYASYGDTVYVIEPGPEGQPRPIRQQFVTLGEKEGEQVALVSGVAVGDLIAAAGAFKLAPGMKVIPRADVPIRNDPAPAPENS